MIKVPISCDEIQLGQWADFREAEDKFLESHNVVDLIQAMKVLFSDQDLGQLPLGTANDELLTREPTFFALYKHITQLIHEYKPRELTVPFKYTFAEQDFFLSAGDTALLAGVNPITVNEAVTLLELTRHTKDTYQAMFNLTLEHIAVLLRKEGEFLPLGIADRVKFINSRKLLFSTAPIPMSLAFDIQAYFNSLIVSILNRFPSGTSSNSKEAREHWERVGWNSVVTATGLLPKEALKESFEDALYVAHYKQ